MKTDIRRLDTNEIQDAHALAQRVFMEFEAPEYSEEGIEQFCSCFSDTGYLNGIVYYGAFDNSTMAGMLGYRPSTRHICFFFVDAAYHRHGIGTKLFHRLLEDTNGQAITVNSSPYAVPFYTSLGFTASDKEQTVTGIRFIPMLRMGEHSESLS